MRGIHLYLERAGMHLRSEGSWTRVERPPGQESPQKETPGVQEKARAGTSEVPDRGGVIHEPRVEPAEFRP